MFCCSHVTVTLTVVIIISWCMFFHRDNPACWRALIIANTEPANSVIRLLTSNQCNFSQVSMVPREWVRGWIESCVFSSSTIYWWNFTFVRYFVYKQIISSAPPLISVCTSSVPFLPSPPHVLVPLILDVSEGGEEETRREESKQQAFNKMWHVVACSWTYLNMTCVTPLLFITGGENISAKDSSVHPCS